MDGWIRVVSTKPSLCSSLTSHFFSLVGFGEWICPVYTQQGNKEELAKPWSCLCSSALPPTFPCHVQHRAALPASSALKNVIASLPIPLVKQKSSNPNSSSSRMCLANGLCQGQVVIRVMPGVYFSVPVNKSQSCLTLRSLASPELKTKMLFWIQSTSLVQVLLFRIWVWNWWSLSLLMPLKLRFQRCVPWSFWVWFKDKPLKLCWSRECLYVNFPFQINPGQDLSDPSKGICYWKTFLPASSSSFFFL